MTQDEMMAIEIEMDELLCAVLSIEAQLGSHDRQDDTGRRLTRDEWRDWRVRAVHARTAKMTRYRELKSKLKTGRQGPQRLRTEDGGTGSPDPGLIRRVQKDPRWAAARIESLENEVDELADAAGWATDSRLTNKGE